MEEYKLVGILNMFNLLPDFIYPIFEKDNKYYLLTGDMKTKTIETFKKVKESKVDDITFIKDMKTNIKDEIILTISSSPIFGFQTSKDEVYFGKYEEMVKFLREFETDDKLLKEQIEDFVSYN